MGLVDMPPVVNLQEFTKRWNAGARTMSELDPAFMEQYNSDMKFTRIVKTTTIIIIAIIIAIVVL